jgi:hypothetical protein
MEGMTFEGPKGTVYIRPEDHVAIQDMYILKLVNVTDPEAASTNTWTLPAPNLPACSPKL